MATLLYNPDAYLVVHLKDRSLYFDKVSPEGRRLRLDFEASSNRSDKPNRAVVQLYGLNEDSRDSISSDGVSIELYAGFGDNLKLIFLGDIIAVQDIKLNPGWAIRITAGDGFSAFTQTVVSKTYASGTEKKDIIKEIADSMGMAIKMGADAIAGKTAGDVTLDGLAKDALRDVVGDSGASFSAQDGELHISDIKKPIDNEAIVISSETGLLESPVVTDKGVNIRAVLNPDIRPGKLVKLESIAVQYNVPEGTTDIPRNKKYNGFYLVQAVTFVGNNEGGAFDVIMETVAYE